MHEFVNVMRHLANKFATQLINLIQKNTTERCGGKPLITTWSPSGWFVSW